MEAARGSTGTDEEDQMLEFTKRFAQDESGASSIEHRLIAAGIVVAILIAMGSHAPQLMTTFAKASSQLAATGKQAWHC
jgi:Flp pilus assembly pilin Flp